MGNDGSKNSFKLHHLDSTKEIITKNSFNFYSVIGKGGFGKVWKVLLLKNQKQYALKEMLKVKIIEKQCVKSVLFERDLLSRINHPYIFNNFI